MLTPLAGAGRTLADWLTTFHLASVVLDPYTNESAWILDTAARVLREYRDADIRVSFVCTAEIDDCKAFLGPLAKEFLVFADPARNVAKALGLAHLPAFVFIQSDGTVQGAAEGWNPLEWRAVSNTIATVAAWSRPTIPALDDPSPFAGTAALG